MNITKGDIEDFKENLSIKYHKNYLPTESFHLNRPSISFLVVVKNAERTIQRCINSILKNCDSEDEIKIIDTGSKDKTIEMIHDFDDNRIKLFEFKWVDDFSKARNYAKSLAEKQWVFFIDSDEYMLKNTVFKLKKYICILKWNNKKNIFINPTIINTNDHIINGVSRIFENNNKVIYKGLIHEYPYVPNEEIEIYAFESILLMHDGYDNNVVDLENKIFRNLKLLEKMKQIEKDIRWDYLYCRDGSYVWDDNKCIRNLEILLKTWSHESKSDAYYSATRDLIELYLNNGYIDEAKTKIEILRTLKPNESDIYYFESIISWFDLKSKEKDLLSDIINYKNTRTKIDYGALHSNYYHLDFLISLIMISQGELEKGFKIQKKLNEKGVYDFTIDFNQLNKVRDNYYSEVKS